MSAEPVETLVERVREALTYRWGTHTPHKLAESEREGTAALTELAERLEAAERERDALSPGRWYLRERAETAEARVAALEEALSDAQETARMWQAEAQAAGRGRGRGNEDQ